MSQKKQPHIKVSTSKQPKNKVVYFKKEFKLMIHNITLEQEIRSAVFSLQAANYTSIPHAVFHITINSTVDITTIDMTSNEQQKADLQVTLDLSHFAKGIKNDLAIVKFQVAKQKILAPSSVNFYTQPLANRKGTIEYKFVGQKVTQIDEQEFLKHNIRRDQIIQIQKQLAQNPELKRLVDILDGKDEVIKTLQKKIASLIEQTRKLTHNLERQTSQQRKRLRQGLNLNLNVNASNNYHMKRLNEKLSEENQYLQKRLEAVEQQLESTQKQLIQYRCENNILQIQIGKKSIIDGPTINLNPSKSIIEQNRQMLQKIHQQEYDQQLQRKSKMADSFFLAGDDSSVKSKVVTGRRPHQSITINPGNVSGLTPRGNSKGRTKSVIDPSIVNNLQQQLNQSKLMDQQQVQLQLNELKDLRQNMENKLLEAVPQQDGMVRYPRLQAAIKSSYRVMERLNEQKNLLEEKLKRRQQQIQYLRRQLEKSKQNFKNFQKQLRERSSNAKDQFEQRMAAIKLQTQMKMAQMRRQNRFSDYESVMQTEKRQIEIEKMRYENDALREKYQQAMNELRNLQLQKASEQNKYKTVQAAINKQKEMYKSKYYQMQDSFTKQQQELQVTKQKAKMYQAHVARIQELQKVQETLKAKIDKEEKQIQELKNKIKRYEDKFTQIEPKWEFYRQMEHEFELVKKKNQTVTRLNERFESRMEEIKKFANRLENAYYQKRQKHHSQHQFDEHYKKQLQQRLQATFKKLRAYQREFYQQQMKELTQTKKDLIEFYYKRIVEESQRIDQNPTYTQADKQKFKNQREHQINIVKQGKLDQLDKQFKKYEAAFGKLVSTEEYLPKGLNQKIFYLEQKMRKFQIGEFGTTVLSNASQSILKNTVDRLNDSIRDKESQITQLKRTIGKMSDGSSLLKVNNVEIANQRKSMIEEMQKSRQIFTKSLQDLKKANQQLLKQKSQLQIEVQNYRFRQQKLIFKNTQREKQLQRISKKNSDEYKKKISDLEKALQKKNDQNLKNKILKEQFEDHTKQLLSEVNSNASLLEKLERDLKNIEEENEQLKSRLELYHEAEKILLQQVDNIKKQADFDLKSFKALLQQRNAQFQNIKRIKDVEIEKLNKTIQQYEYKIQTQVNEYLHTRRDLQTLQQKYSELQSQLQETKVSYHVVNENYHKVEEESVLKIHELEEANVMLETNLMEMAEGLKEKEMELQEAKIKQQSLYKQIIAIKSIKDELAEQQTEFVTKQKHYEQLIEELTEKLSTLQKKYEQISDKVHQVQRQNSFVNLKLIQKESQVQDLRDKLNKKYDQINQIKSLKFDTQMKVKQLNAEIQEYHKMQQKDNQHIRQLQQEVQQLRGHVQALEGQIQQQQMQKSRLKPPPKTNLMSGSAISENDLGATRMGKSVRQGGELKKTLNLSKKEIKEIEQSQKNNSHLEIEQAQSIKASHLNTPVDLNFEQNGPNRFRIWTVNQTQQDLRSPSRKINQAEASQIEVDLSQESNQDANLQSDMSAREKQMMKSQKVFRTMVRQPQESAEESQVIDKNIHPAESYGSSQLVEQYIKEIEALKEENMRLVDDKRFLQEENHLLKQRIGELTGNVEQSQRKNLLASALGLTGGLLLRQQGPRSSVQSNYQNPNIPKLKIKQNSNHITPAISSKQAIRIQDGKQIIHGSIQGSRKSSIHSPTRSPKLSPRDKDNSKKPQGSNANLVRSSVGDIVSTRKQSLQQHIEQQNQRVKELQLLLHQVQQQNKQLKTAYDEQQSANQRLMQQFEILQQAEEQKHRLLEEKIKEVEEVTEYYEGIRKEMEKKIQKLVEEGMEKQGEEIKLLKTFQVKNEEIQVLVNKVERLEKDLGQRGGEITRLIQEKERSYKQFRKYQQESQLEILRLKQQMTQLTELTQKKHSQVELLAQDYFELSNELNQLKQTLKDKQFEIINRNSKLQQLTKTHNQLLQQTKKSQQQKRTLRQRIHQLQNDLIAYQSNMMDVNKATSMTIKKYQIKLNTSEEEKLVLKQRVKERQQTIQQLKHSIALYNEQTDELKTMNKELTLELERTEDKLKDIMKSYDIQFNQLNLNLLASNQNLSKIKSLISQKDQQLHKLTKTLTSLQNDTRAAQTSEHQIKITYQKYKHAKQNQISHLLSQVELKNDEYQKIKSLYEKEKQEFFTKEQEYVKRLSAGEESKKLYKEKLAKYQGVLEELERELEVMAMRPTKQQFDQVEFQNELYKNRIQQLQQMLRQFAPQAPHHNNKVSTKTQQALQIQFKKYKLQKQRQLDDLSNQIDKYALKINELQQTNFMLKKQIQKLRQQMKAVLEQCQSLKQENFDLRQDLTEMREEVEFYKGKRIENLSKLLNETM